MPEPEEFRPRSYSSPVQQVQINDSQDDSSSLDFEFMDYDNQTQDVNDLYLLESIVNNNNSYPAESCGNL